MRAATLGVVTLWVVCLRAAADATEAKPGCWPVGSWTAKTGSSPTTLPTSWTGC